MVNILSTVRMKEDMIKVLEEEFNGYHYKFIKRGEVTAYDRKNADIYVTYGGDMSDEEAGEFQHLKWVMVMSAGVDDVPLDVLDYALITNATGVHRIQMAEYTLGLILNHYKNFTQLKKDQENKVWRKNAKTEEIYDKEVHILGTGSIGSRLAEVFNVLGLKTVGYNTDGRNVKPFNQTYPLKDLNETVSRADILINILPGTKETHHLLDTEHFKIMKDDSIFINIGRGNVISEAVILETLNENYISHMILDVFHVEPLPGDHPFYDLDNITITPHASSKTDRYLERAFDIFKNNLKAFDTGQEMINQVNHKKGY